MNLYEFLAQNPMLGFLLATLLTMSVALLVSGTVNLLGYSWKLLMRHLNIRKAGWPPSHCDADGDLVEDECEKEH